MDIKNLLKKRMEKKKLDGNVIGSIAINTIKKYFDDDNWEVIEWYAKFDKIFIRTKDQTIKIELFKQKKEVLDRVNKALENLWYDKPMKNIYIK